MAFTTTIVAKSVFGNKKVRIGTWANTGGTTGGGIDHNLKVVEYFVASQVGTSTTIQPIVNVSAFPFSTAVTIPLVVSGTTVAGTWYAVGY
jgi:hypothetical protein